MHCDEPVSSAGGCLYNPLASRETQTEAPSTHYLGVPNSRSRLLSAPRYLLGHSDIQAA